MTIVPLGTLMSYLNPGEAILSSDSGFHASIREIWGDEVLEVMRTHPELFAPEAIPKQERSP